MCRLAQPVIQDIERDGMDSDVFGLIASAGPCFAKPGGPQESLDLAGEPGGGGALTEKFDAPRLVAGFFRPFEIGTASGGERG